jgi:hypothetical protein
MYRWLHTVLPPRAAQITFVVGMSLLVAATILLASFPETSLRYARL